MQAIRIWALVALVLLGGACLRTAPPGVLGLPLPREPLPGGIVLVDHHGRPFALDALRGRVTVLAFGYTFCPDVCPATLAVLKRARGLLESEGAQVRVLFVTTDPARDTPERLRWYVSLFHPEFVGLTGTQQSLARLYQAFDVYPTRYTSAGDGEGYRVGHATAIYLIDRQGFVRFSYSWGVPSEDLAADVRAVLQAR